MLDLPVKQKSKIRLTEAELIAQLSVRSNLGFRALYDMYYQAIYAIIITYQKPGSHCKDIIQDIVIKIFQNFDHYNPQKARFYTWLIAVVRNHCLDLTKSKHYKKSIRTRMSYDEIPEHTHLKHHLSTSAQIDTIGVAELVSRLPATYRTAIQTVYYQGNSHTEAADKLNWSLGTVKTRVRLAIRQLKFQGPI